ncbi:hypothetical protein EG68_07386 [Paragonimus skrjabini miyazakii]|uniref:Uncharacterized protein n=1 Tax=Paragonimus skrjabini miyazakii TaxID=59628 RepID=A0A8S9YUB6_9TREM|nr:hypothetical protein EG68_07386 [Paragonimus skrjabini miyazakii]
MLLFYLFWLHCCLVGFTSHRVAASSTNATTWTQNLIDLCVGANGRRQLVCDPERALDDSQRQFLQLTVTAGVSRTMCFCNTPCNVDDTSASQRLVIGTLFLKKLPTQFESGSELAELLRARWSLGSCPGNDVLMLAIDSKIYLSYGPLVSQKLIPKCMKNLATTYEVQDRPDKRIRQLAFMLKTLFLQSCVCGSCETPQLWFKIVAMLLACMSLLMWLSLFGRRAYMRRNTLLTARGRYSLSNVHNGYADRASLFRFPARLFHNSPRRYQSQQPPQIASLSEVTSDFRTGSLVRDSVSQGHLSTEGALGFTNVGRQSPPPPPYSSIVKSPSPLISTEMHNGPKLDSTEVATSEDNSNQTVASSSPPSYLDVLEYSRNFQPPHSK